MYAVIATGGKQVRVAQGQQVHVELLGVEQGAAVDFTPVLVVDGDPLADIRILQDKQRLKEVISRGNRVDLTAPWPERRRIAGEKVGNWAAEVLTYDRAMSAGRS